MARALKLGQECVSSVPSVTKIQSPVRLHSEAKTKVEPDSAQTRASVTALATVVFRRVLSLIVVGERTTVQESMRDIHALRAIDPTIAFRLYQFLESPRGSRIVLEMDISLTKNKIHTNQIFENFRLLVPPRIPESPPRAGLLFYPPPAAPMMALRIECRVRSPTRSGVGRIAIFPINRRLHDRLVLLPAGRVESSLRTTTA